MTIRFAVSTTPFMGMWQLPQVELSPKGSSFLYASKEMQTILDPLVVSWGYETDPEFGSGNHFIDYHEWQGTRDPTAFLSVPTAIDYMKRSQWNRVRTVCHQLAVHTRQEINALTGLPSICPEGKGWLGQMVTARLPDVDTGKLQEDLYEQFQIEVPVMRWKEQALIRVSIQEYNTRDDVDKLIKGLACLL